MLADFMLLCLGFAILLGGGEVLVRGAASLARGLGISPLAIGLTVVAFGTSAPELAVNVDAALRDTGALSFGNVFGSNMANIGLVIGLISVIRPIPIENIVVRRELPMMLLALAAASVMSFDKDLGGSQDALHRTDGLILLLFFVVFMYYTVGDLVRRRSNGGARDVEAPPVHAAAEGDADPPRVSRDIALSVVGLVGLIGGANLTVNGAVGLARGFAVPEVVIGLTIVSVGTSLPELVSAIVALRHGKTDLAVGSIVGSNIFNVLLIAGVTATIRPMEIPPGGHLDLGATAILSLAFTLMASTHRQLIIRSEGALLLAIYLGYIVWRTLGLSLSA